MWACTEAGGTPPASHPPNEALPLPVDLIVWAVSEQAVVPLWVQGPGCHLA